MCFKQLYKSYKLIRAHTGSRVERIGLISFLPQCLKRWLNQLCASYFILGFFCVYFVCSLWSLWMCLLPYFVFSCSILVVLSWLFWFSLQYQCKWLPAKSFLQNETCWCTCHSLLTRKNWSGNLQQKCVLPCIISIDIDHLYVKILWL